MKFPRTSHCLAMTVAFWLAAGEGPLAQDTLARAKDLYVQAAYDEALVVLDRLNQGASGEEAAEITGYQVFCLLALGRTGEAQRAIETLVKADPLYRPSDATASPRTRAVFDDVRRTLLPRIAQESYDKAKAAFDRQESQLAAKEFERLLVLLNEPGLSDQPGMADLRRLATGFRDLSAAAAATAAAAAATKAPERPAAPVVPPPPPTYTGDDANVVAPVVVSRKLPVWRPRNDLERRGEHRGVLAVVIDEKGDVVSASLSKKIHPDFDEALLKMARTWKFRPATKDGVPVRYRAGMEIRLRPDSETAVAR